MPTTLFPVFPEKARFINSHIAVKTVDNEVYYANGEMIIFKHARDDYRSFRFFTSQLIETDNARQKDIQQIFQVSPASVKRWCKVYREQGPAGFYKPKKTRKKGNVLTTEKLQEVQGRLDQGESPKQIEGALGVKADTVRKAIQAGRLSKPVKKNRHQGHNPNGKGT